MIPTGLFVFAFEFRKQGVRGFEGAVLAQRRGKRQGIGYTVATDRMNCVLSPWRPLFELLWWWSCAA